jgi:hypothetical protein
MKKKHILCYGDSNTWGYNAATGGRYDDDVRWTQRLGEMLGPDYLIGEAGLNGRTTVFEDPLNEGLNGLTHLLPAGFADYHAGHHRHQGAFCRHRPQHH